MSARFAAIVTVLTLALLPRTALAQAGFGTAAGVAATVGATASPPSAGGIGDRPASAARPVGQDVDTTGALARAKHSHTRKPYR